MEFFVEEHAIVNHAVFFRLTWRQLEPTKVEKCTLQGHPIFALLPPNPQLELTEKLSQKPTNSLAKLKSTST